MQFNDIHLLGIQHLNNQEGKNNFLFQKQERILDLDLGYDFWKFRYSDATTGRFWMVDPLAQEFAHNSLYAFQENKLDKGVELEGAELKEFGEWLGKKVDQVLSWTDVDDVTVVVTNVMRGGNAVHIDGQPATGSDKVFAAGGLLLPAASGAAVKKIANKIINAVVTTEKTSDKVKESARFIADTDGKIIDTKTTPKGSYVQPDGSRTDVLQQKSHTDKRSGENHGTSHTHESFSNKLPNGEVRTGQHRNNTHKPTNQEVKNIQTGEAKKIL